MYKFTLRICLLVSFLTIISTVSFAQASISNTTSYSQNFDAAMYNSITSTPIATLPAAWRIDGTSTVRTLGTYAAAGTTTQQVGGANMSSSSPTGFYNFGAGTTATGNSDRAVGGLTPNNSSKTINVYLDMINTGASPISTLNVSYSVEKYRSGDNADGYGVWFYYSTDGSTWLTAGAVTGYPADANENGFSTAPDATQTRNINRSVAVPAIAQNAHIYLAWSISVGPAGTGQNTVKAQALGIDNVVINGGIAAGPPAALYFRSVATGNWSDATTWESTTDPATIPWAAATTSPTYLDRTITVRSPNVVTVTADVTTDETTVEAGGTLSISTGVKLSVNDGTGFDLTALGTVTGAGNLIIKSVSTGAGLDAGTASVGPSAGTISVSTTVERFIGGAGNKSAWRFLTAPLTGTGSIFNTWQNGGNNVVAGIGTTVSGPGYNTVIGGTQTSPIADASGLDYRTAGASLYTFDVASQAIVPVTNTKTALLSPSANVGYYIFIRGDRGSGTPNSTTLSATGNLQLGAKSFTASAVANAITLIGNPYASAVDLDKFNTDNFNSSNVKGNYYYWDPYLTGWYGVGGYVTVSYAGVGSTPVITPLGSIGNQTKFLQSGQAMFVETKSAGGAGTVVFNEAQKDATSVNTIFRVMSATEKAENVRVNLNVLSAGASLLVDGVVASFNSNYSAKIDDYDATKFQNQGESIALMRDNKAFAVERLPLTSDAVLYLNLYRLKENVTYQFEITPSISNTGVTAFIVDNYLKTTTEIDLSKSTTVNFTVNSDAASTGANRFYISFAKPAVVVAAGKDGLSVFPNPATNGVMNLQMNNMAAGVYNVRVFNSVGQVITTRQINHAAGSSTETIQLGKGTVKGVYQLEVVKPDNSKFSSKVIAN